MVDLLSMEELDAEVRKGVLSYSKRSAEKALKWALAFFKDYLKDVSTISTRSIIEQYMIVNILNVYLYSKYYTCGMKKPSGYEVVPSVIAMLYNGYDKDVTRFIKWLLYAGAMVIKFPYNLNTTEYVQYVLSSPELLTLLRYEGILDKDLQLNNLIGSTYKPVSCIVTAVELIDISVDSIRSSDSK